ncbi:short-chain dehydrogenase [Xylogone sp. PMI_703]|nr:short-chain dehydrogenase [Xylogone sp. PMI_703]
MPSISGLSILIIGGSSGIGFAVAKLALQEGVKVAIASSNHIRVATAVDNLKKESPSGQITGHQVDLKLGDVEANLEKLFTEVVTANGGNALDHVIFTAGDALAIKAMEDIDVNFILEAGKVRFVAPLLVAKILPRFIKSTYKSSFIITTGTISQKAVANWSVVSSYMTGLHGMTRNLAVDLKPIRVNLVSPGAVDTELWGADREKKIVEFSKTSFMGRVASAEEVAESYIYLMKDTNATGSVVSTNGGSIL